MIEFINNISLFLSVCMSAIVFENALLTRILGIDRLIMITDDLTNIFTFGSTLTICTTLGCIVSYILNIFLYKFTYNYSFIPFIYVLSLSIIYIIIHLFLKNNIKDYKNIEKYISVAVFNCAVLGSMIIVWFQNKSLLESIALGFGTGIGYTLATLLISEGNRKSKNRSIPRSFKGLPFMLLYTGILSMALFALRGYKV